jgi:hypothetical protein
MANPVSFMNSYFDQARALNQILQVMRNLNDQLTQDPTLADRYFASNGARTDIVSADVTAAKDAVDQVIFAFDSGAPPQKSLIYKIFQ